MDGLFALALSPKKPSDSNSNVAYGLLNRQNERALYFHSLASGTENAVSLNLVNNASIWERDSNSVPRAFQTLGKRGIQAAGKLIIESATHGNTKKLYFSTSHGQKWKFVFCFDGSNCHRLLGLFNSLCSWKHQNCFAE